ncbi:MAG: PilZ domain-containing protein [Candidatus Brocadiae bacterium]|nr:PilZ domain-containing protein [Candidatus Brocadiia bacterium]
MPRSVLVADPRPVASVAFGTLLRGSDYTFVGSVAHGRALLDAVHRLGPWAVTVDLGLPDHPSTPGVGWVNAARVLIETAPAVRVVVTCSVETRNLVPASLAAGVKAYIEKPYLRDEILRAFDHVSADRPAMPFFLRARRIARRLGVRWLKDGDAAAARRPGTVLNLSETGVCLRTADEVRARDVLQMELDLPGAAPVRGRGQVVRQVPSPEGGWDLGIAFVDLDPGARDRLRQFVERVLHAEQYSVPGR